MNNRMNIGVIISVRTASTRLPGKALKQIGQKPMIIYLIDRIMKSNYIEKLVVATTELKSDDYLVKVLKEKKINVFRGSEKNLIRRYIEAAKKNEIESIVRITGDCPFVDHETLDYCIEESMMKVPFDLSTTKGYFPTGIDYEIVKLSTLQRIEEREISAEDKEHLTLYIYNNSTEFKINKLKPREEWKSERCYTVDTIEDYVIANERHKLLGKYDFRLDELIKLEL